MCSGFGRHDAGVRLKGTCELKATSQNLFHGTTYNLLACYLVGYDSRWKFLTSSWSQVHISQRKYRVKSTKVETKIAPSEKC